jgi:hypothetical protein
VQQSAADTIFRVTPKTLASTGIAMGAIAETHTYVMRASLGESLKSAAKDGTPLDGGATAPRTNYMTAV